MQEHEYNRFLHYTRRPGQIKTEHASFFNTVLVLLGRMHMVQVKKADVRDRILEAATTLFAEHGYARTTIGQIAEAAEISSSNVYVYFESKLKIMFAIYEPWFKQQLDRLDMEIPGLPSPDAKVFHIVQRLWRDIAADENGFSYSVIQAISAATPEDRYDPTLLHWTELKIANLLRSSLPPKRASKIDCARLAHVLMMSFDGFVLSYRINGAIPCDDKVIAQMCNAILGKSAASPRRRSNTASRGNPLRLAR
jgi:AcrR family transcriptional regulator